VIAPEIDHGWPYRARAAFDGVEESVAGVRRFLTDALTGTGFDAGAAVLAVSELACNAVLHSNSRHGKYDVWIGRTATILQVLVVDDGPLSPARRPAANERCGGYGLTVVKGVTSDYGHYDDAETGCHVAWFRITLPAEGVVPRG
jgi:anti-sigma regulatory factor (Ser/Thr protein kinase)